MSQEVQHRTDDLIYCYWDQPEYVVLEDPDGELNNGEESNILNKT